MGGMYVYGGQAGGLLTSCPAVSETQGCPVAPRGLGHSHSMARPPVQLGSQGRRDGRKARPAGAPAHPGRETARLLHHSVVSSTMKKCTHTR